MQFYVFCLFYSDYSLIFISETEEMFVSFLFCYCTLYMQIIQYLVDVVLNNNNNNGSVVTIKQNKQT